MIDKVEVRVPGWAEFRKEFRFLTGGLQYGDKIVEVRQKGRYRGVVDLRPFGIEALLHAYYRFGERHDHKLEIISTGFKTLNRIVEIIEMVFCVDALDLDLIRVDLAVDIWDVPVSFFHQAMRVKFKRTTDERGRLEYETIGKRRMEYLRYGKAPNCLRVYDKPEECRARYRVILKGVSRDADIPTFEQTFGIPENATITRIERQLGGGRIPAKIDKLWKLGNAADFNPFSAVEIVPNSFRIPDPAKHGVATMVKLTGVNALVSQFGLQGARALLNAQGNAKRDYLDEYANYTSHFDSETVLTQSAIYERYRASLKRQTADAFVYAPKRIKVSNLQSSSFRGVETCQTR